MYRASDAIDASMIYLDLLERSVIDKRRCVCDEFLRSHYFFVIKQIVFTKHVECRVSALSKKYLTSFLALAYLIVKLLCV